jgi:hypothetical protein
MGKALLSSAQPKTVSGTRVWRTRVDPFLLTVVCRQVRAGLEWPACADLPPSIRLPRRPLAQQDVRHGVARPSELACADRLHGGGSCRIRVAQARLQGLHLLGAWGRRHCLVVGSICREGCHGLHGYVVHFSAHRDRDPSSESVRCGGQDWCIFGIRSSSEAPTTCSPPS